MPTGSFVDACQNIWSGLEDKAQRLGVERCRHARQARGRKTNDGLIQFGYLFRGVILPRLGLGTRTQPVGGSLGFVVGVVSVVSGAQNAFMACANRALFLLTISEWGPRLNPQWQDAQL